MNDISRGVIELQCNSIGYGLVVDLENEVLILRNVELFQNFLPL